MKRHKQSRCAELAAIALLLLSISCHTMIAAGEAVAALPKDAATKLVEAPLRDLEALLSMLLRLFGL